MSATDFAAASICSVCAGDQGYGTCDSHGLEQTSVAEVARVAGLTHGALYRHFQSEDALTAEAMTCAFDDCLREFTGAARTEVPAALSFN